MRTKLFILGLLGILAIGCSRKSAPTISLPTEQNPCDKAIKAVLDSVQSVDPVFIYDVITEAGVTDTVVRIDSTSCQQIKLMALDIVAKYNTVIKEREFYKALAQSQAKKIINNINSGNKNSQIGDNNNTQKSKSAPNQNGEANVAQETGKGVNQNGEGNDGTFKPKDSQVGDGNDMDRSKKSVGWFWIFVGGYLFCHVLHKIIIPGLMGANPFTSAISKIKTITGIFRS